MKSNHQKEKRAMRNKIKRKRRHNRQLESRLKNQYEHYLKVMNNFEYNTWISEVSNKAVADKVYTKQVSLKNNLINSINKSSSSLNSYDIINESDILDEHCNNICIIS